MAIILNSWVFFASLAGVGLFTYSMFAKLGGGNLPPVIFATIMYIAGFVAVLPLFFWYMKDKPAGYLSTLPTLPVIWAIGAGVVVIVVDMSVSYVFNHGAPVGSTMTIVYTLCLLLVTAAGIIFFKENYHWLNLLGIAAAMISIPLMFYNAK